MNRPLTRMQERILCFIADFVSTNGYPPSVREVADHAGLASTSSVHYQLGRLEALGFLRRAAGRARAVSVVLPDQEAS